MIDWLAKMFKPQTSSATAKERLRLVLLSDHLSLAPEVIEALRLDLIAVISKYVEVDESSCDVTFERQDSAIAMLANIPILSMKRPPQPPAPRPPMRREEATPSEHAGASIALTDAEASIAPPTIEVPQSTQPASVVISATQPTISSQPGPAPQPKRRRRRKPSPTVQPAPAQ